MHTIRMLIVFENNPPTGYDFHSKNRSAEKRYFKKSVSCLESK
jgi:hypothetical protein